MELLSSALAQRLGIEIEADSAALLVRFAGNEKSVAYQLEQSLAQLRNGAIETVEVVNEDRRLWQAIAALPLQERPSFATRVLPAKLGDSLAAFAKEPLWQAGAGDGRIRVFNRLPEFYGLNFLAQRVKQQLDPMNLFRAHDDEHDS